MLQRDSNPFKYSDSNKRYHTYDHYMRSLFGCKCYKVPISAGFTCPNIDGTKGTGGCIYCSGGSRSVISDISLSPYEQFINEIKIYRAKDRSCRLVPYFQSFSCTYGKIEKLKEIYDRALLYPDTVGIAIGTRADCINEENVSYLASLAERTHLTVELGLQSSSDKTARLINRCHTYDDFLCGYSLLRRTSGKIRIGIHVICGLPGETESDFLKTAYDIAKLRPDEVKIHLLHVLAGTELCKMYQCGDYVPIERDEYIRSVCRFLELMPPETVIGRLTGDGDKKLLMAPAYSKDKKSVLNGIDKFMYENNMYQGRLYKDEQ
ncbi:MAG: TIGR01212 family radical SAM protein [Clostridia bacterium]|nr:TIGR01212 family radical SAM protein [Clostridia bacterium]